MNCLNEYTHQEFQKRRNFQHTVVVQGGKRKTAILR